MSKQSVYEIVTAKVLAAMQTHGSNWVNPFNKKGSAMMPHNAITKRAYNGTNVWMLMGNSFQSNAWATYNQWSKAGAQVRKGEKGETVILWMPFEKEEDGKKKKTFMLRYFTVFNAEQVDGYDGEAVITDSTQTHDAFDQFVEDTGAVITTGNIAAYSPTLDVVVMPRREAFTDTKTSTATENYYSTLAHELTHWTGHKSRLDRLTAAQFGSEEYAFEELVAEMGAAFLCAKFGISNEPRADHAQYLNSWMKRLQSDSKAFIRACGLAQKAVAFLTEEEAQEAAQEAA